MQASENSQDDFLFIDDSDENEVLDSISNEIKKLNNAAYKDWLTNLPNRLEFVRQLDMFAKDDCDSNVAALIDLNHFSDVNMSCD